MDGKQQFGLALAAAAGGLAWGYACHRGDRRVAVFALIQAAEWFVAYGGAAAVLASARQALEHTSDGDDFEVERVTRIRQSVTEPTGTDG
ncbi:MAG: hypothetical protein HOH95_11960 [Dehalococcoidia bacterium]|jgi:hypothetical protein|nr:hypothetical protein [Dehalococcoidia bacterium]